MVDSYIVSSSSVCHLETYVRLPKPVIHSLQHNVGCICGTHSTRKSSQCILFHMQACLCTCRWRLNIFVVQIGAAIRYEQMLKCSNHFYTDSRVLREVVERPPSTQVSKGTKDKKRNWCCFLLNTAHTSFMPWTKNVFNFKRGH